MDGHTLTQTEIVIEARSILGNVAVFGLTQDLINRASLLHSKAGIVEQSHYKICNRAFLEMYEISTTFNLPIIGA